MSSISKTETQIRHSNFKTKRQHEQKQYASLWSEHSRDTEDYVEPDELVDTKLRKKKKHKKAVKFAQDYDTEDEKDERKGDLIVIHPEGKTLIPQYPRTIREIIPRKQERRKKDKNPSNEQSTGKEKGPQKTKKGKSKKKHTKRTIVEDFELTREEVENLENRVYLYKDLMYTAIYRLGCQEPTHPTHKEVLCLYAMAAFGLNADKHLQYMREVAQEPFPITVVEVVVLEAEGLAGKDVDGLCDPYCIIGIGDKKPLTPDSKRKHKLHLHSETHHSETRRPPIHYAKVGSRQKTTVKLNTLAPLWNETFFCATLRPRSEMIHVEVWDLDEETVSQNLKSIRGFRDFFRFFRETYELIIVGDDDDDFLGRVSIKIADIPSSGINRWYHLQGRAHRTESAVGKIHLDLRLAMMYRRGKRKYKLLFVMRELEEILTTFLHYELSHYKGIRAEWSGVLPLAAETLIHQFSIQTKISLERVAAIRWMAYARLHAEEQLNWALLHNLLSNLHKLVGPDVFYDPEEKVLLNSFDNFYNGCLKQIQDHWHLFPHSDDMKMMSLRLLLQCVGAINDIDNAMDPHNMDVNICAAAAISIKNGTLIWYEDRTKTFRRDLRADAHESLEAMIEVIALVNQQMLKAKDIYHPLFARLAHVPYIYAVYDALQEVVVKDFKENILQLCEALHKKGLQIKSMKGSRRIKNRNKLGNQSALVLKLYIGLQQFTDFQKEIWGHNSQYPVLSNYHTWFSKQLAYWLVLAFDRCTLQIEASLKIDTVTRVDEYVKHGVSAVDTVTCFFKLRNFWQEINWPDCVESHIILKKLMEYLSDIALFYIKLQHKKLKELGYYDTEGQFDITEKLCVSLNNIEFVMSALSTLPKDLKFDESIARLKEEIGEEEGQRCRAELYRSTKNAENITKNLLLQVASDVGDMMRSDIRSKLKMMTDLFDIIESVDSILPLMEYLDLNLVTLRINLLPYTFKSMMAALWVVVNEEIHRVAIPYFGKRGNKWFRKLSNLLDDLYLFFFADGLGLTKPQLHTVEYRQSRNIVKYQNLPTDSLIDTYLKERTEVQQSYNINYYGELTVHVFYMDSSLNAEIVYAKDLQASDCDSFVTVDLFPEKIFPNVKPQRTDTIKNTRQPIFMQCLKFQVSKTQCQTKGATILFTLNDEDLLSGDDFLGEAYLSLSSVEGIRDTKHVTFSPHVKKKIIPDHGQREHKLDKRPKKDDTPAGNNPSNTLEKYTTSPTKNKKLKKLSTIMSHTSPASKKIPADEFVTMNILFQENTKHPILMTLKSRTWDKEAQQFADMHLRRVSRDKGKKKGIT